MAQESTYEVPTDAVLPAGWVRQPFFTAFFCILRACKTLKRAKKLTSMHVVMWMSRTDLLYLLALSADARLVDQYRGLLLHFA